MSLVPLVEHLVRSVVDEPDAVQVQEHVGRDEVTFSVSVAPDDVGKIIGKSGRIVSSVRYVVSAASAKQRQRAYVKVITD